MNVFPEVVRIYQPHNKIFEVYDWFDNMKISYRLLNCSADSKGQWQSYEIKDEDQRVLCMLRWDCR